jgi:hypothetical protein
MKIEELVETFKKHHEDHLKRSKGTPQEGSFNISEALHVICQEIVALKGSPKSAEKKSSTPFIKDKELFKAVNFADAMVKKGTAHGLAVQKASNYYQVSEKDVDTELTKRKG